MLWYCSIFLTLCQTAPPAGQAKPPQVEMAEVMFTHGQLEQVYLNFAQAPKRGGRVLAIVPSPGLRAELVIIEVKPSELDGFDVTLDLTSLVLVGDAKQEYSQLSMIVISPAPATAPFSARTRSECLPENDPSQSDPSLSRYGFGRQARSAAG